MLSLPCLILRGTGKLIRPSASFLCLGKVNPKNYSSSNSSCSSSSSDSNKNVSPEKGVDEIKDDLEDDDDDNEFLDLDGEEAAQRNADDTGGGRYPNIGKKRKMKRKIILVKDKRPVILSQRKINDAHEEKAKTLGLEWRTVSAA